MNLEDRLKEHFDAEAEHLYVPAGSIDAAKQRGSRRRATRFVAGATLAFAIVGGTGVAITVANSGSDGDGNDLVAATESTGLTQPQDDAVISRPAPASGGEPGDLLANVDYSWEPIQLPGGGYGNAPTVAYRDGTFVAIHQDFSEEDGSHSQAFVSTNGRDWTEGGSLDLAWIDSVFASELGFIVTGDRGDGTGFGIVTSPDGITWSLAAAPASDRGHLSTTKVASGNGVTVLAGTRWLEPPIPPIELTEAGVVLTETGDGRVLVTSLETGDLLFETDVEVLFGGINGMTVFDQATGEAIVTVPFEVLDKVYAEEGDRSTLTIDYEGYLVVLSQEDYSYEAYDQGGNLIQSGSQDELYRRPRFVLSHPVTGEIAVDVPIEVYEEAQDAAYRNQEFIEPQSETLVYSSTDGVNWRLSTIELPGDPVERETLGVAFLGGEFVLVNAYWSRSDNGVVVLRSSDGVSWSSVGESELQDLGWVSSAGGEFIALSYGRGTQIVTSEDGIVWDDGPRFGSHVSIQAIAGDGPAVAFGTTSPDFAEPVITATIDGKELTIDGEQGYLSVVDNTSGELLAEIVFDPYAEEPPAGIKLSLDGFDIFDSEGNLVLEVGNADLEQAYEDIAPLYEDYTQLPVLYLLDQGEWKSISTTGLDVTWVRSIAVGAGGTMVVTGESITEGYSSGVTHSITSDGATTEVTEATLVAPVPARDDRGDITSVLWLGTRG